MASPRLNGSGKRHLTVLKSEPDEPDDVAARRPWQWVGFGAVAIFTAWVPLAALAMALAARVASRAEGQNGPDARGALATEIAVLALYAGALALGAALGGMLVGRWGPRGVGVREAALAGLVAAIVAGGLTWVSFGPSAGALLLVIVVVPAAALGGRSGARARARPPS